jgi:hypothetical protein
MSRTMCMLNIQDISEIPQTQELHSNKSHHKSLIRPGNIWVPGNTHLVSANEATLRRIDFSPITTVFIVPSLKFSIKYNISGTIMFYPMSFQMDLLV